MRVRDLLLGIGDLLIAFENLTPELLVLLPQPIIFALQLFLAVLIRVPMATRGCPGLSSAASRFCTHPPYVKRFGAICPEKSTEAPELLLQAIAEAIEMHDAERAREAMLRHLTLSKFYSKWRAPVDLRLVEEDALDNGISTGKVTTEI